MEALSKTFEDMSCQKRVFSRTPHLEDSHRLSVHLVLTLLAVATCQVGASPIEGLSIASGMSSQNITTGSPQQSDIEPPCILSWPRDDKRDVCEIFWGRCEQAGQENNNNNNNEIIPISASEAFSSSNCAWSRDVRFFDFRKSNCHGRMHFIRPGKPQDFAARKEQTGSNFRIVLTWNDPKDAVVAPVGYRLLVTLGRSVVLDTFDIATETSRTENDRHQVVLTTHQEACSSDSRSCILSNIFRNNLISPQDHAFVAFQLTSLPLKHDTSTSASHASVVTAIHLPSCRDINCPSVNPGRSSCPRQGSLQDSREEKICHCVPLLPTVVRPDITPGTNHINVMWQAAVDPDNVETSSYHVKVYRNHTPCRHDGSYTSVPGHLHSLDMECGEEIIHKGDIFHVLVKAIGFGHSESDSDYTIYSFTYP